MARAETNDWFIDSLVKRVPDNVAGTFSSEQLDGLKSAFRATKHKIDIRDTYSLFGKGFYLVLLAGLERRGRERRREDANARRVWTPANIIVLAVIGAVLAHGLALLIIAIRSLLGV